MDMKLIDKMDFSNAKYDYQYYRIRFWLFGHWSIHSSGDRTVYSCFMRGRDIALLFLTICAIGWGGREAFPLIAGQAASAKNWYMNSTCRAHHFDYGEYVNGDFFCVVSVLIRNDMIQDEYITRYADIEDYELEAIDLQEAKCRHPKYYRGPFQHDDERVPDPDVGTRL
jgi:hypothetical protein